MKIAKLFVAAAIAALGTSTADAASYYNVTFQTQGSGTQLTIDGSPSIYSIDWLHNVTINYTFDTSYILTESSGNFGFPRIGGGFSYSSGGIGFSDTTQWGRYANMDRIAASACVDLGPVTATPTLGSFTARPGCGSASFGVSDSVRWRADYSGTVTGVTISLVDGEAGRPATFVNGVPEPKTWALMLSGFGLIGHALRRRRTLAHARAGSTFKA